MKELFKNSKQIFFFFFNLKSNGLRPELRNCRNGVGFTFLSPPFLFSSLNTDSQKLICRQSSREDLLVFALGARKGTLSDERVQKSLVFVVIYFALVFSILSHLTLQAMPWKFERGPSGSQRKTDLSEKNPPWFQELWFLKSQGDPCYFIPLSVFLLWSLLQKWAAKWYN